MNRLLCFATALLLFGAAVAADRVTGASSRRAPKWIGGMEEEYIIVSAEAATLGDAQQKAISSVREQIVSAIATRVHSATRIMIHEVAENGTLRSHREMIHDMGVAAADIPYLAEVSPSQAADFYWQKRRRRDKFTYYIYHIKYPLSHARLHRLTEDYEKQQKMINDSLQAFAAVDFADYDDVDRMMVRHSLLKQFAAGLREDDGRRKLCDMIRNTYEQMLKRNLHIEALSSDRQQTVAALFYGSKQTYCSLIPKTKTNCLTAIETALSPNTAVITYDYSAGCYDDEQNWLEIIYTVLGQKISARIYIP